VPVVGVLEWFRPGEHERVEQVLADLAALGVTELRTGVSWADWYTAEGEPWYRWLLPRLARDVSVLPCFVYTPPSIAVAPRSSAPPREPKAYADWLDVVITRYGRHFEWMEMWNKPNSLSDWDVTLDPYWWKFCEMVGGAAYWARKRGKKTALGGLCPIDPNWLRLMFERGVMDHVDAVGIHGSPGTFDHSWDGWDANVQRIREVLREFDSGAEVWITETGFSTWRHDDRRQLREFVRALEAPVDRVYWYGAHDLQPAMSTVDGFHADERDYHFGLKRADGTPKLLYRLWSSGGLDAVREAAWMGETARLMRGGERPVLITGGAGFIGTNLAHCLLNSGQPVLVYDNLSRPGVERNLRRLRETHGERVQVEVADIRDPFALYRAVGRASQVFHFAAQVAVTTSLSQPIDDFEVNARGTLNLLEAIRCCETPPPVVFTSTNKVYGGLDDVPLRLRGDRYEPADFTLRATGIGEERPLDFHSPYGCSKGAADQYVLDYARTFDLPAVVFRMSCIYGPHQFGTEDQGWVAHFLIRAIQGEPITLYGDGMQVRDVLFVEDLVDAFLLAQANMESIAGQAFNIGGGPGNTTSLLELLELIHELHGEKPDVEFGAWRPGDQRYYVSNVEKFRRATGWAPRVDLRTGIGKLHEWLLDEHGIRRPARLALAGAPEPAAPRPTGTGVRR
jgi:CDP-paratose 2-epimerase